jgi:two-component system alkaline phosphatase synthesis response regulator PhoP
MEKIFIVEDDESIKELICYALNNSGFMSYGFEDANGLYKEMESTLPNLIVLDIMLPGDDGYEILYNIRSNNNTKNIPVIMLTAKNSEYDKIKGLDMGADDYITKPFGVMELISRINAVLRRSTKIEINNKNSLSIENIFLDSSKRIVLVDGKELSLTFKEFELLYYLMSNQDIVLTRDKLMNEIWGFDFEGESRTVDVHIRTLRQKLGKSSKLIQTVRNVGYKIGL